MKARELTVKGALELLPDRHTDNRGEMLEWFSADQVREHGPIAQANLSVSKYHVMRGLHWAQGQGKVVTCMSGMVVDCIFDLRTSSPTHGHYEMVSLSAQDRTAVWIPPGVGHAFLALSSTPAVLAYLLTTGYDPDAERGVHPLSAGIYWPLMNPTLSQRDADAPTLAQAREQGLLPP